MSRLGRGHAFDNPTKLAEMLELRRQWYSYHDIAFRYGIDHSSVVYQCMKAGVSLTKKQYALLCELVLEGFSIEAISERIGATNEVIEAYCLYYGVRGSNVYPLRKRIVGKFSEKCLDPTRIEQLSQRRKAIEQRKELNENPISRLDEHGVLWRQDGTGGWICMGKQSELPASFKEKDKKRIHSMRQLKMLTY